jgi:hypothetical protein
MAVLAVTADSASEDPVARHMSGNVSKVFASGKDLL